MVAAVVMKATIINVALCGYWDQSDWKWKKTEGRFLLNLGPIVALHIHLQ